MSDSPGKPQRERGLGEGGVEMAELTRLMLAQVQALSLLHSRQLQMIARLRHAAEPREIPVQDSPVAAERTPTVAVSMRTGPAEITRGQRELLALIAANPTASGAYCEFVAFELRGSLDLHAFQSGWQALTSRHEALRLRFTVQGQAFLGEERPELGFSDRVGEGMSPESVVKAELARPLPPHDHLLARAHLVRVSADRHVFVLAVHHLMADGWSIALMLDELCQYHNAARRRAAPALETPRPFSDFVAWAAGLESPSATPHRAADLGPDLVLPSSGSARGFEGFRIHRRNPVAEDGTTSKPGLMQAARACARMQGTSPVVVMLTGFAVFLARLAGQRRLRIGLPMAGHTAASMPLMVGMASVVLPVDVRLDGVETFSEAVRRVGADLQQARQGLHARFASEAGIAPPSVLFNIDPGVTLDFDGLALEPLALPLRHTKADLFLNLLELNGEVLVDFDCNGALLSPGEAERWLDGIVRLVGAACLRPDTPIRELDMGALRAVPTDPDVVLRDAWGGAAAIGQPAHLLRRIGPGEFSDTRSMAKASAGGELFVLGHVERYVRLPRGWVDLDAVEQALVRQPSVRDAAACVESEAVTAFVSMQPGGVLNATVLGRLLTAALPLAALPSAYVEVGEIARDADGRFDVAGLLAGDGARLSPRAFVAPRDDLEAQLVRIWSQVLDPLGDPPGVTDDFFALGGHSLKAVILAQRVAEATGKTYSLAAFFQQPTISGLAHLLRTALPVQPIGRRATASLDEASHAQRRMWVLEQIDAGQGAYNMGFLLQRDSSIRPEALRLALSDLSKRHESLRSAIVESDGEIMARIDPHAEPVLEVHDLRAQSELSPEALALDWVTRPFDLARAPLWRVLLVHSDDGDALFVAMHHAIGDNWSATVWIRDFLRLLAERESAGRAPAVGLPPLRVQYADYAAWHNRLVAVSSASLDHWARTLADPPERILVPAFRARPGAGARGAWARRRLDAHTHASMIALAQSRGVSAFVVLLACWRLWLWGQTGARDAVVGTVHAGRDHPDLADQVGLFVNTLPLRIRLSPQASFEELLEDVRQVVAGAFEHAHVPLNFLLERLGIAREAHGHPLFETLVTYDDFRDLDLELGKQGWSAREIDLPVSPFELTLTGHEDTQGLELRLLYRLDLWSAEHVDRMLEALEGLLCRACRAPQRLASDLAMAPEVVVPDPSLGVVGNFDRWRKLQPAAPAVLGPTACSYDDLGRRADDLAARLVARSPARDEIVAVLVGRDWPLPAAVLGVLRAGAAFVLLEPAHPLDRLLFVLRDARCRMLVHDADHLHLATSLRDSLPAPSPLSLLALDGFDRRESGSSAPSGEASSVPGLPERPPPAPSDLAYLIYTSGSTGQPKGVLVDHGAVAHHLWAITPLAAWSRHDRSLLFATVAVDAVIEQLLLPLVNGASFYILDQERYSARAYVDAWRRWDATILDVPPLFWGDLIAQCQREPDLIRDRSVKTLISGGEEMTPKRVVDWWDLPLHCGRLLNVFGPTETVCSPMVAVVAPHMAARSRIPIGRPIGDRRARVVDEQGAEVEAGDEGELLLGAASVARGYLNQELLTAERFVVDAQGVRWYRTGDRVRLRPDGDHDYLGRVDRQFKLRGFRIEPGEIENLLRRQAGIRDAVVTVESGADGGFLQAWLVVDAGAHLSRARLVASLSAELPAHMVPSRYRCLSHLPVSASEKLDRKALQAMPGHDLWDGADDGAARAADSPLQRLCELVARIVDVPAVLPTENFFAVGGHSLKAVQVVARVRDVFAAEISLRDVFAAPSIADLWDTIAARGSRDASRIVPIPRDGLLPASAGQQRLWLLQTRQPDNVAYNMVAAFRLDGALRVEALRDALQGLLVRHEVLRTRLRMKGGILVQEIAPKAEVTPPEIEHSDLPDALEEVFSQELRRPFDLESELPARFRVLAAGRTHGLVVNLHHVAFDGWSATVMLRDLAALYQGALSGATGAQVARSGVTLDGSIGPLEIQYADYAHWQRTRAVETHRDHWLSQFAGVEIPALALPTDHPRPDVLSGRGGMVIRPLGPDLSRGLRALATREGVTLFGVLAALVAAHLSARTGDADLVLGAAVAGRESRQLEDQIGFYVNMLPLRCHVDVGTTFAVLARSVGRHATEALLHQDFPFDELVYQAGPPRRAGRHPFFDVIVNVQNFEPMRLELPEVRAELLQDRSISAKLDLQYAFDDLESIDLYLEYAQELYDESTAEGLADGLIALARSTLQTPDADLRELLRPWTRPVPEQAVQASPTLLENDEW